MVTSKDTICAIASGMGNAGIGIIRVSGPDAITLTAPLFVGKKNLTEMSSYTACYGKIMDGQQVVDEVIVLVMKAPHTYTTEDVVEIDCHGGMVVMRRIVDLLIKQGIRAAEPGEFTKRAYLGGRIDMTQAEAVMDTIHAQNEMALKSSVKQLQGALTHKIVEMREKILHRVAYIESALDDPENYSLDGFSEELQEDVDGLISAVDKLLKSCEEGKLIREGIHTAIVGKPNAGKSSVLNMLLGEERAIVTSVEGTTRDTLEEYVSIGGVELKLIDTAGIRDTADIVEKIGVDKAKQVIEEADLILYIVDGSVELSENDFDIIEDISGKKIIPIVNKNDLDVVIDFDFLAEKLCIKKEQIISVSAKEGNGLEELKTCITEMFFHGNVSYNDELYITNSRHKEALLETGESLLRVQESIGLGVGEDFYTIDLMAAYETLGKIIGETLEDDLADKIFREFCMGK